MTSINQKAAGNLVLFLCTGNYYRSRLAELYFNAKACTTGFAWTAMSRGLRLNPANPGPISRSTLAWLRAQGIFLAEPIRHPVQVQEEDFQEASVVVAVKEAEHRPLVELYFPKWTTAVEYWHVHDQDCAAPEEAIPELVAGVDALLGRLAAKGVN
jgi:protein-tyrosine phosphatase